MNAPANTQSVLDELNRLRTRDDAWQIPREEAIALHELIASHNYKSGVEIGTSYGYSALHFALALRAVDGILHTIDISQKKFDASRQAFTQAGLGEVIVSHLGDARTILPTLPGNFDFAFLDAAKDQIRDYFDLVWPRISPGGVVLTDNITTHPELAPFVQFLRALPDAKSSTLAIGNGVEITYKLD